MADLYAARAGAPAKKHDFEHVPRTETTFEKAFEAARRGDRLTVDQGVELLTTGTDRPGVDPERKARVLELADQRRRELCGDEVTFVANMNLNVTTACTVGCLFCNFKDSAHLFEKASTKAHDGFTRTVEQTHRLASWGVRQGISEICSVSGLHPAFVLNEAHRRMLEKNPVNYKPPHRFEADPGSYVDQLRAMKVRGVHLHSMTPEEAYHAKRGTDWSYARVYGALAEAGLDSVPGTAAEVLVDEVRDVICPGKIDSAEWVKGMEGAAEAGLPMTSTLMYGHVENELHRVLHLNVIRELQDRTGNVTEFVPLKFVHPHTPLFRMGLVSGSSSDDEDELIVAVSRLFLDNIENVQVSWVKYGDARALHLLNCGGNDLMGTLLSEEITQRAGGAHGTFRSFADYVGMIESIGRVPVERSTDYRRRRVVEAEPGREPGPMLGPLATGAPLLAPEARQNQPAAD